MAANQSDVSVMWQRNQSYSMSKFGHSMQYFVYRLGHCVKIQEDPSTFLQVIAIVQLVISIVGFLGAVTSVAVTSSRRMRSSTSVYLTALGVYDAIFTMSSLISSSLRISHQEIPWLDSLCNCLWTLCVLTSAYVIIAITVERSLSVAKPYFMEKYRSVGLAIKINVVILLTAILLNIPQILDEILDLSSVGGCKQGQKRFRITSFGRVYSLYVSVCLIFLIPFFTVLVMNIWFACTLVVIRRGRKKNFTVFPATAEKQQSAHDDGLIRLTIGLTCWYTVCWLLPAFYYVYKLPRITIFDLPDEIKIASFVDTLIIANAAVNAIFYFLLWRQFRLACVASFKKYWKSAPCHHDPHVNITTSDLQIASVSTRSTRACSKSSV